MRGMRLHIGPKVTFALSLLPALVFGVFAAALAHIPVAFGMLYVLAGYAVMLAYAALESKSRGAK